MHWVLNIYIGSVKSLLNRSWQLPTSPTPRTPNLYFGPKGILQIPNIAGRGGPALVKSTAFFAYCKDFKRAFDLSTIERCLTNILLGSEHLPYTKETAMLLIINHSSKSMLWSSHCAYSPIHQRNVVLALSNYQIVWFWENSIYTIHQRAVLFRLVFTIQQEPA